MYVRAISFIVAPRRPARRRRRCAGTRSAARSKSALLELRHVDAPRLPAVQLRRARCSRTASRRSRPKYIWNLPCSRSLIDVLERRHVEFGAQADRIHVLLPQRLHLARSTPPVRSDIVIVSGLPSGALRNPSASRVVVAEAVEQRIRRRRVVQRLRRQRRIVAADAGRNELVCRHRLARVARPGSARRRRARSAIARRSATRSLLHAADDRILHVEVEREQERLRNDVRA